MDVRLPDGTLIQGVPDGMSKADLTAKLKANGYDVAGLEAPPAADEPFPAKLGRAVLNVGAGAVRGAGSIGATLLTPIDAAARALGVQNDYIGRTDRREAMDDALRGLGADTDGLAFQGGKLGAEIAGTLGAGGVLAGGARALGAGAPIVNALQSAGMTTGGRAPGAVNLLKDLALRSFAGGAVGGASTALVDPEHAGTGAAWGAALPPALSAAGGVAKWIGGLVQSGKVKTADDLAKALELLSPADRQAAIAQLRSAPELVPGSQPTVAQALPSPRAAVLERVVSKSPGGEQLLDVYAAQNAARRAALEKIAPTNLDGLATAKDDLGHAVERYVMPEQRRIHEQLGDMYRKVDPHMESRIGLPFDEFKSAVDTYLGPGTFGQGAKARAAVDAAERVGKVDLPAVKAAGGETEQTLLGFVKAAGGIDRSKSAELSGELQDLLERGLGRFSFKGRGRSIDKMAEAAHEAGFIASEDPAELVSALMNNPGMTRGVGRDAARAMERTMGELPQAERVPVPVTWDVVQNLRTSINNALDELNIKGTATKEIGALTRMKRSLDETMMDAAVGNGKPGDYMPSSVVAKFLEANKSYSEFAKRFRTGTNAELFYANGPRGGEIAEKYWRGGAGGAERVDDFKRLIGDMPGLMEQFRSMATTDAASKMTAADQLSSGYVRWVSEKLPALRKAFTPEQVQLFQDVAADIKRAAIANGSGRGAGGSDTYQNAAKALNLGLFGNAVHGVAKKIGGHVPFAGGAISSGSDAVANAALRAKASRLASMLADPSAAADALERLGTGPQHNALLRMLAQPEALNLLYRATPVGLAADH